MDTPSSESSNEALDINGAQNAFASLFEPVVEVERSPEELEKEAIDELTKSEEVEADAEPVVDEKVTIEVDGKTVELTKAELADAYKNGLRQADYTKKTMEVADARKTAEAESSKAKQERAEYANSLYELSAQLKGALEQQNQIDWDALINTDPVEAMKQQHLLQKRQAAYHETQQRLNAIEQQSQAEKEHELSSYRESQQQELLAKLPDWKDPVKAQAEATAIKTYLKTQGFDDSAISNITDHRAVLLARDAMLYRQMMSKAQAAAKKVTELPQRTIRPGVTESNKADGRSVAMQKLSKTGSVDDAASAFKQFL